MVYRPEKEPYANTYGFIRSRNRVELEGLCITLMNEGKFAGRLRNIRYGTAMIRAGVGTDLINNAVRAVATSLGRLVRISS